MTPTVRPRKLVDLAHPGGVARGQVVVDRHHVDAAAGQAVQVDRQRRRQRLAFAGAHLRDLAVVQDHAADQLDVEVAHAERALGGFAANGERFRQQLVEHLCKLLAGGRFGGDSFAKLHGLGAQRVVRQCGERGLQGVDSLDDFPVLLQQSLIATAEYAGQDFLEHGWIRPNVGGRGDGSAALHGTSSGKPLPPMQTKPKMVSRDPLAAPGRPPGNGHAPLGRLSVRCALAAGKPLPAVPFCPTRARATVRRLA